MKRNQLFTGVIYLQDELNLGFCSPVLDICAFITSRATGDYPPPQPRQPRRSSLLRWLPRGLLQPDEMLPLPGHILQLENTHIGGFEVSPGGEQFRLQRGNRLAVTTTQQSTPGHRQLGPQPVDLLLRKDSIASPVSRRTLDTSSIISESGFTWLTGRRTNIPDSRLAIYLPIG